MMKWNKQQYQDPRWQQKRLKIFERDNWECQACGEDEITLNIHHIHYYLFRKKIDEIEGPWDYPDNFLVSLCNDCHEDAHKFIYYLSGYACQNFDKCIEYGLITPELLYFLHARYLDLHSDHRISIEVWGPMV